jgi:hypothetical protein
MDSVFTRRIVAQRRPTASRAPGFFAEGLHARGIRTRRDVSPGIYPNLWRNDRLTTTAKVASAPPLVFYQLDDPNKTPCLGKSPFGRLVVTYTP